jgi:hypothetical protein
MYDSNIVLNRNRRKRNEDKVFKMKTGKSVFSTNKVIEERVLKQDYRKLYTFEDLTKWIEWGLRKNIIKKSNKKEDIEVLMKWIDLLGRKSFDL